MASYDVANHNFQAALSSAARTLCFLVEWYSMTWLAISARLYLVVTHQRDYEALFCTRGVPRQGLTLVDFSAQLKHFLCDALGTFSR